MPWVFALLAGVVIVALALVLAGRLPTVPQPTRQRYVAQLPPHPTADDVDQLRLPVVVRGYRMDDVDAALTVLRDRIAELEKRMSVPDVPSEPPAGPRIPFAPESVDE